MELLKVIGHPSERQGAIRLILLFDGMPVVGKGDRRLCQVEVQRLESSLGSIINLQIGERGGRQRAVLSAAWMGICQSRRNAAATSFSRSTHGSPETLTITLWIVPPTNAHGWSPG
jgi:hypothetical protein